MANISLWQDITVQDIKYPELTEDIEVDVAIVGGGITGITAAYHLMAAGKKVAILEAHRIASGTTGNSTGNLYVPIQPYYQTILKNFDKETVKIVAESRQNAIDYIDNISSKLKIECQYTRRPMYLYTSQDEEIEFLTKEVELLKESSIDVQYINELPMPLAFKKAAMLNNQARFNPRQYVVSLTEYLNKQNGFIFENSRVLEINEEKSRCVFKTGKGKVVAKKGILATHTPSGVNPIQFFTAAYRSYVVAVELENDHYPDFNSWNLEKPHYAMSTHSMKKGKPDLLVVAGSHHKTGFGKNTEKHYRELDHFLAKHFKVKEVKYRWSAQHYLSADGIPYIGRSKEYNHIYEATGFFADGLVYGTIAGVLLGDIIVNKSNHLKDCYNIGRHQFIHSLPFLIKENFKTFLQYAKDMPDFSKKNYQDVKKEQAKVITIEGEKCGVYRDANDKLHIVSAVCTHMKCILNWNSSEKTWDCPCHGSRFSCDGVVIEGPARINLTVKRRDQ